MTSHPTQEEVDDILGAALDALDDLDGSNSDDEQDTGGTTDAAPAVAAPVPQPSAATSAEASSSAGTDEPAQSSAQTQSKVYYGPEPPPATAASSSAKSSGAAAAAAAKKEEASSSSASLEDAMSQLLRAGEALQKSAAGGVGGADDIDLEGAEKMLDEIMGQLQLGGLGELMGGLDVEASNDKSSSDDKSSKGTDKKADKKKNTAAKAKTENAKSSETKESVASSAPKSNGNSNSTEADVDRAVQRLLSDMAKAGSDDDDAIPDLDALMNGGNMEAMGEEMMESMMKELSAFGASGDADDVVDGMMRQLLSKELMYEPMKQVCDRFPAWLAESKAHLSEDEYQK